MTSEESEGALPNVTARRVPERLAALEERLDLAVELFAERLDVLDMDVGQLRENLSSIKESSGQRSTQLRKGSGWSPTRFRI